MYLLKENCDFNFDTSVNNGYCDLNRAIPLNIPPTIRHDSVNQGLYSNGINFGPSAPKQNFHCNEGCLFIVITFCKFTLSIIFRLEFKLGVIKTRYCRDEGQ